MIQTPNSNAVLSARNLSVGYRHNKKNIAVLNNLHLELLPGELVCVLGPNGAGKSTLIRTIAGIQPCLSGSIHLLDGAIDHLSARELAKRISIVLTEKNETGNLSVYSLIALGRYPYTDWLGKLKPEDEKIIHHAIAVTGLTDYINRNVNELSDGERQKVMIARALAQQSPIMFLDEPTAYLDLPSKAEMMSLLKKLVKDTGKAILVSTHDLELALQAADKVWLISSSGAFNTGVPEDLILNELFAATFNKKDIQFDAHSGKFRFLHHYIDQMTINGNDDTAIFWTKKALEREGYQLTGNETLKKIEVINNNGNRTWSFSDGIHPVNNLSSIEQLIKQIKKSYNAKTQSPI